MIGTCRSGLPLPMPRCPTKIVVTNHTANPLPMALLVRTESATEMPLPDARVMHPGQALELWLLPGQTLQLSWPLSRGVLSTALTRTLPGSLLVGVAPVSYDSEATATFAAALTATITGLLWSRQDTPPAESFAILQGVTQLGPISVCNATFVIQCLP